MKVLIVENETDAVELLSTLIVEYLPDLEVIGSASSITEAEGFIRSLHPEIIFLDINLDDGNGFELLDRFSDPEFKVIFTTAHDKFAVKAFRYNALDYLLKPYSVTDLKEAVGKFEDIKLLDSRNENYNDLRNHIFGLAKDRVPIYTHDGIEIVFIENMIRYEGERAYCKLFLSDGKKLLITKPLSDMEAILPEGVFYRVHRSHLVNINHIRKYKKEDGGSIIMSNEDRVPVARRKKEDFLKWLKSE